MFDEATHFLVDSLIMRSETTFFRGRMPSQLAVWAFICMGISGCEPESIEFTGVKRIHERITPSEWLSFQRVVDQMPDHKVPALVQSMFPGRPDWSNRTVPVSELYTEERRKYEEAWDSAQLAPAFERHKALLRVLRKEKLTTEQFAGLLLTIGAATCRNDLPADIDLTKLINRAGPILNDLSRNSASYKDLLPEAKHDVIQQAMWISRKVRAEILRQVPSENLALAEKYHDWIVHALPEEYCTNPVYEIRDLLEEQGLPFEELPESGFDEDLHWPQASLNSSRE